MSKSPIGVAKEALQTAEGCLTPYDSKHNPKKYTEPQLFAILVLRQFFRTDYRGIVALLREHSDLRKVLKLKSVPHDSTLVYAAKRFEKRGIGIPC